jgi:hypothetical protein
MYSYLELHYKAKAQASGSFAASWKSWLLYASQVCFRLSRGTECFGPKALQRTLTDQRVITMEFKLNNST